MKGKREEVWSEWCLLTKTKAVMQKEKKEEKKNLSCCAQALCSGYQLFEPFMALILSFLV